MHKLIIGTLLLSTSIAQADAICTQVGTSIVCNDLNTAQGQLAYGRAQSDAKLAEFEAMKSQHRADQEAFNQRVHESVANFGVAAPQPQRETAKKNKSPTFDHVSFTTCASMKPQDAPKFWSDVMPNTAEYCVDEHKRLLACGQTSSDPKGAARCKVLDRQLTNDGLQASDFTFEMQCWIKQDQYECGHIIR